MITKQQIEDIALDYAFREVFVNVGDDTWPDEPMLHLDQWIDHPDQDTGDYEMMPWEPFENETPEGLYSLIMGFQDSFERAIKEALLRA